MQLRHCVEEMGYELGTVAHSISSFFGGRGTEIRRFSNRFRHIWRDSHLCPIERITPRLLKSPIASITPSFSGAAVIIRTPMSLPMAQSSWWIRLLLP